MMETFIIILKGLLVGFVIGAPFGPTGLFCLRRMHRQGGLSGFISVLGIATAVLVYGSIAAFGLTAISTWLMDKRMWMWLVGSFFLFYLAFKQFRGARIGFESEIVRRHSWSLMRDYSTTFFLTIISPVTIIFVFLLFPLLGLKESPQSVGMALLLIGAIFIGSISWWLIIKIVLHFFGVQVEHHLGKTNSPIMGIIIAFCGCYALYKAILLYAEPLL